MHPYRAPHYGLHPRFKHLAEGPGEPVEAAPALPGPATAAGPFFARDAALVARAEALGVKVDGRWGNRRLRREIAAAERKAR